MDRGVLAAIQRFPQWRSEIQRRALADTAFRALCEDLVEAEAALAGWARAEGTQAAARQREYDTLVGELADEIAGLVADGEGRPA